MSQIHVPSITYTPLVVTANSTRVLSVKVDGKRVGYIRRGRLGYFYAPIGSKDIGDTFPTVDRCKQSLETDL